MEFGHSISVVIAVWNRHEDLAACLAGIRACRNGDTTEVVVVDDGSDAKYAREIASATDCFRAQLIRLDRRAGPAAARNRGARATHGEILLFLDSDVVPSAGCLDSVAAFFSDGHSGAAAVIGSYDQSPFHPGIVSQYRNLLHSHVHQTSAGEVSSFWAGCGAVRRDVFFAVGSFDESFRFPSVEDVEFGGRVHRAGYRILLDPSIQVTHRKEWTLRSMLLTDFARRSIPWTMLAWSGAGLPRNLNFTWGRRASVALATLAAVSVVLAFFDTRLLFLAAAAFLAMTALNIRFLRWRKRG